MQVSTGGSLQHSYHERKPQGNATLVARWGHTWNWSIAIKSSSSTASYVDRIKSTAKFNPSCFLHTSGRVQQLEQLQLGFHHGMAVTRARNVRTSMAMAQVVHSRKGQVM